MDFHRKYLKYKNKYLHLKQKAGYLTEISNIYHQYIPILESIKSFSSHHESFSQQELRDEILKISTSGLKDIKRDLSTFISNLDNIFIKIYYDKIYNLFSILHSINIYDEHFDELYNLTNHDIQPTEELTMTFAYHKIELELEKFDEQMEIMQRKDNDIQLRKFIEDLNIIIQTIEVVYNMYNDCFTFYVNKQKEVLDENIRNQYIRDYVIQKMKENKDILLSHRLLIEQNFEIYCDSNNIDDDTLYDLCSFLHFTLLIIQHINDKNVSLSNMYSETISSNLNSLILKNMLKDITLNYERALTYFRMM
jgi:hypothetical protein